MNKINLEEQFWNNNFLNNKQFIITNNKIPIHKFGEAKNFSQIKNEKEFGLILPNNTILIDIDDQQQAEIFKQILFDHRIKTLIIQTNKGKHFYFKSNLNLTHLSKGLMLCGLISDIKTGNNQKNAYALIKQNNQYRKIEYFVNFYELSPLPIIARHFKIKSNTVKNYNSLLMNNLQQGERNNNLFAYGSLIRHHFNDGIKDKNLFNLLNLINKYYCQPQISQHELWNITNSCSNLKIQNNQSTNFHQENIFWKNKYHNLVNDVLNINSSNQLMEIKQKIHQESIKLKQLHNKFTL